MELPFKKFYDLLYERQLTPQRQQETGVEYFPRFGTWSLGMLWNMLWYADLVRKARVVEFEYAAHTRSRQLPASHNHLSSEESEALAKVSSGLRLLNLNLKRIPSYRQVLRREQQCLDLCSISQTGPVDSINVANCITFCQKPIAMLRNDVTSQVEAWRNQALTCMSEHGVASGDKNAAAFDQCISTYADSLIKHVGDVDDFDNWLKGYSEAFKTNEPLKFVPGLSR
jgi:hypothetical protein